MIALGPQQASWQWVAILAFLALALAAALGGCGSGDDEVEGGSTETTALVVPVQDDQCLECHESDLEAKAETEQRQVFSHGLHLQQRIRCHECHQDVGHEGAPIHDPDVCVECHGLSMPHPAGYLQAHGADVEDMGDTEVCQRCHNVYLHCQECHGLQMPHPEQWRLKHGEIAYPEMQTCKDCHADQDCLECHPVVMPHPEDWTGTHGLPVVEQGSEMCTTCHEPELCASCHGMPMPHPGDWATGHQVTGTEKREECLLCHDEADCRACHEIHESHGQGGGA